MKKLVKWFAGAALMLALFIPTTVYGSTPNAFTPEDFFRTGEEINRARDPRLTDAQRAEYVQRAGAGLIDMLLYLEANQPTVVPFHGDLSIREISESITTNTQRLVQDESLPELLVLQYAWGLAAQYRIDPMGNFQRTRNALIGRTTLQGSVTPRMLDWASQFRRGEVAMLHLGFGEYHGENPIENAVFFAHYNPTLREEITFEIIAETNDVIVAEDEYGVVAFVLEGNSLYLIFLNEDGRMVSANRYMPLNVIFFGEERAR